MSKTAASIVFVVFAIATGISAMCDDSGSIVGIDPIEISIWNGPAEGSDKVEAMNLPHLPFEYINPKLSVFLPPEEKRNGSFVLVIPGGGYIYCSANGEGFKIARWFVEHGISAGVVQYRRNMFEMRDPQDKTKKEAIRVYDENVALEDAMRSMRIVRAHADTWKLDRTKIGIIGFSAGGHISATMGVHPGKADPEAADETDRYPARPDFMILAYSLFSMAPPLSGATWRNNLLGKDFDPEKAEYYSCQNYVTPDTPPCFLVCTSDDFTTQDSLTMYQALKAKRVPCELHIFEKGRHGYGMTPRPDRLTLITYWPMLLEAWLKEHEVIPSP